MCRRIAEHDRERRHADRRGGDRQEDFGRRIRACHAVLPGLELARGPFDNTDADGGVAGRRSMIGCAGFDVPAT